MLRIVFVFFLVLLFVVPVYKLLKTRTTRVKNELEDEEPDFKERLNTIKQKQRKLQVDVNDRLRVMKQESKEDRAIQIQIGRITRK
jgi:flagellar biosynthesis/type III secretory pathway M-ring protein FliF/YscJ